MLFLLAWRNLWRNRRRTLISAGSVFFAVLLAVIMRSSTDGVYDGMIQNVVSFSSGFIQVHQRGYWEERSIEQNMLLDSNLIQSLIKDEDVRFVTPRLESFALGSNAGKSAAQKTRGLAFIGVAQELEKKASRLDRKVIRGRYFDADEDKGLLMGEGLADYFKLVPGDTLVLLSQGYHAATAAALFPLRGIVSLGSPALSDNLAYMTLPTAQNFLSADGMCSAVSLYVRDVERVDKVAKRLRLQLQGKPLEVMTWKEMMPELDQFVTADRSGHLIIIGILYLVISFGLYSTVLMMTFERSHEFGILISIGMRKRWLAGLVFMETLFVSALGALAGMAVSFFIVLYFYKNPIEFSGRLRTIYLEFGIEPIIHVAMKSNIFLYQALIVFILSVCAAGYPILRLLKLKPVEAMRT